MLPQLNIYKIQLLLQPLNLFHECGRSIYCSEYFIDWKAMAVAQNDVQQIKMWRKVRFVLEQAGMHAGNKK